MSSRARNRGSIAFAWDGALDRRARFGLIARAVAARIASLPALLRQRHGIADIAAERLDPDAIALPDGIASLRAIEHVQALSEPWLFHHCLRTYAWGALLAQNDRLPYDKELLFVASALHDLALADAHAGHTPDCACFAIAGARAAHRFASETIGWERERCDRLADAVALHLNVSVSVKHGPEAYLLNAGAALDVVGLRMREITAASRADVLSRYPRLHFSERMAAAMKVQASAYPRSRTAVLVRLGFRRMIRDNPLERLVNT
jgi:hypothetical protein